MRTKQQLKHFGKLASTFLLGSMLFACSSTDEEDENAIAELTEIQEQFEPKVIWEKGIGDGVEHYFSRLKPTVAYNKVFTASRQGQLVALEAESGTQVWSVDLGDLANERGFLMPKRQCSYQVAQ